MPTKTKSNDRGHSHQLGAIVVDSDWHERRRLLPTMTHIEYGRFESTPVLPRFRYDKKKIEKPRQEICAPLKWMCFFINFFVFIAGVTALALGIYLCVKDPRPIQEWIDFILNPAILLTIIGLSVCFVSLTGLFGALRDNIFLLKMFAICVFFFYILLVVFTFLLFILFYSDTADGISAHSILLYLIKKYHTNRNLADFVDYLQEQMECCGVSSMSQGFRDWQFSEQFNCNSSNPYPERCGVPFSCCRKSVVSEAAGSSNPLLPAMRSLQCWQNAQTKRVQDLETDIYVKGCLQPVRTLFESHAIHFGAIVAICIIPVCFSVCLSHLLARQIDYQRYLLEREERQFKRRQVREKRRLQELEKKQMLAEQALESGTIPPPLPPTSTIPNGPPLIINDSLPHRPTDKLLKESRHRQRRAISTSPSRVHGVNAEKSPATGAQPYRKVPNKKRRRSAAPTTLLANNSTEAGIKPIPIPPSDIRTHQWVLQQSDLAGQK